MSSLGVSLRFERLGFEGGKSFVACFVFVVFIYFITEINVIRSKIVSLCISFSFPRSLCKDIWLEGLSDKLIIDSVPRTKYIKLESSIRCCNYYYFVFVNV